MTDIKELEAELNDRIAAANSLDGLEQVRVEALGKKGRISGLMKTLGGMSPEERKVKGPAYNGLKGRIAEQIEMRRRELETAALEQRLASESVDVTLPVQSAARGCIHPVSQVMDELAEVFADLGFAVAEGPHIENDFYNFTALNIPEEHPAREMFDTFYLNAVEDGRRKVLRTHTSPVQIRTMMSQEPPIRIIAPGRTFRSDSDATHTPMFHQVEGLVIDESTHMGHLKGCIESFVTAFFEVDKVRMRFRPSYFPFTEPSAEVDVNYTRNGDEIRIGEGADWLEIMGCGMVHPKVIDACGLDPERYQGFAFGCGIDRLAMLKYGMPDLRAFFDSDLRWLRHYGFSAFDMPSIAGGLSR